MGLYYLLFIISIAITLLAQLLINSRYKKYSKINSSRKMAGFEIAQEILKRNGLSNVYVVEVKGFLSDHFDPKQNVVRLSSDVYHGTSISSVAVAAHECGHAIQYKEGNKFMQFRSFIVPFVNLSSKLGYAAIIIGILANLIRLAYLGLILMCVIVLFQLVTLPVEFDASRKAMVNLEKYGLLNSEEKKGAGKVLFAAALTYVAGLITALIEVFRLFIMITGRRD